MLNTPTKFALGLCSLTLLSASLAGCVWDGSSQGFSANPTYPPTYPGGPDYPAYPPTITTLNFDGVVSVGALSGCTVSAYLLNPDATRGILLTSATCDDSGQYQFTNFTPGAAVVLVATGGSYIDQASGATVPMDNTELWAMLPSTAQNAVVPINPLTHMAAKRAAALIVQGNDPDSAISDSNTAMAFAAGLENIGDITQLNPASAGSSLDAQSFAAGDSEAQYAAVLAGLSEFAASKSAGSITVTSLDVMTAFASDFEDGIFDGVDLSSKPIAIGTSGVDLAFTDWTSGVSTSESSFVAATSQGYSAASETLFIAAPPSSFTNPSTTAVGVASAIALTYPTAPAINQCNPLQISIEDINASPVAISANASVILTEMDDGVGDSYDTQGTPIAIYGSAADCAAQTNALSSSIHQGPIELVIDAGQSSTTVYFRVNTSNSGLGIDLSVLMAQAPVGSSVSLESSYAGFQELYF